MENTPPQQSPDDEIRVWIASYNCQSIVGETAWISREKARTWVEQEIAEIVKGRIEGEWQVQDDQWELETPFDGVYAELKRVPVMDALALATREYGHPQT